MARILLTTVGSQGDINPFIALAYGLRERGHAVRFVVMQPFVDLVRGEGFAADELPPDHHDDTNQGATGVVTSIKQDFQHNILPSLPAKIEVLRTACRSADLVVSSALHVAAAIAVESTHVPWASLVIPPLCLPTMAFAPMPQPRFVLPRSQAVSNVLAWAVGAQIFNYIAGNDVQALRRSYGLPPRRNVLLTGSLAPGCIAVAISPAFLPRPFDWLPVVQQTGFCFWDTPRGWQPSPAVDRFLGDARPIVAVSAGSSASGSAPNVAALFRTSVAAIRQLGLRALVVGAESSVFPDLAGPDVLVLREAPFSYVYPRCAAVIHHGGIGTIAQALRAAVPMLVVPHGLDQFFSADRVARVGAGTWLNLRRATLDRVTAALDTLLTVPAYRETVAAIAPTLEAEDGTGALCDVMETFLAHR